MVMRSWFQIFILAITLLMAHASVANQPLPKEQAFIFSAAFTKPQQVLLTWQMPAGYYLYRQRLTITSLPADLATPTYPQGEFKYNNELGRYEVLMGLVDVPVMLKAATSPIQLIVQYQGCSEGGFCYPPMRKTLLLNVTTATITDNDPVPVANNWTKLAKDQNSIQTLLTTEHLLWVWLIFAGLGLLLAFTPCVLPMVPILTSIIVGQGGATHPRRAFFLSLAYVLGTALTYAAAGIAAALVGSSIQVWLQQPLIIALTSGLFILLALSLFGCYELRLPYWWQNHLSSLSNRQRGGHYIGVFIMGIISTLIISPCVTAPLVGVLLYISQSGSLLLGGSALFAMGIGMGIPLLIIGTSAGKWLPKSGPWMEVVKKMFGVMMLAVAIWLLSRFISATWLHTLWGIWLLGIAVFIGVYLPRLIGKKRLNHFFAVLIGLGSLFYMVSGIDQPYKILPWLQPAQVTQQRFNTVHDLASLNEQLSRARAAHQMVLLDFYADWCEACIVMEKNVFSTPQVQQALNTYVLIRADLTANTAEEEALMKHYGVIAPPTMIFFDAEGRELSAKRIVGEVSAADFLTHLRSMNHPAGIKK